MSTIKIKKILINLFLGLIVLCLLNSCSAGSSSTKDNLTSNWVQISQEDDQAAINSMSINSRYNSLIISTKNHIHTYNILENDRSWHDIEDLPDNIIQSLTTIDNLNLMYVGLESGQVMSHTIIDENILNLSKNNWTPVGDNTITDISPVTSIIKSSTSLFIGNEKGNIWFNNQSENLWKKISAYSASEAINQVKIDNSNNFLGILNANGELWVCKINVNKCINLTTILKNTRFYNDTSLIKAITLYSNGNTFYGYLGNQNGNIWRIIINDISRPDKFDIEKLSDSPNFPGYHNLTAITALLVNNNSNDLYAANQDGNLWLLSTKDKYWHNLNNQNNSLHEAITSIVISKDNILYIGNNIGKVWQVTIGGFSS